MNGFGFLEFAYLIIFLDFIINIKLFHAIARKIIRISMYYLFYINHFLILMMKYGRDEEYERREYILHFMVGKKIG